MLAASAGSVVEGGSPTSPEAIAKRMTNWQERVLKLAASVPEVAGASALVRNSMSKIEFEVEGPSQAISDQILKSLETFPTGRAGQLLWLVGESIPSWRIEGSEVIWEAYSPAEFKAEKGKPAQVRNAEDKFVDIQVGEQWYRNWQPDVSCRYHSWSAHKALLDLMESMYLHQLADTAVATSRLAGAGILYWPTNLPSLPLKDGRPEEGSQEELQMMLSEAMTHSIKDRNGADAFVPMVVFGDSSIDSSEKPTHILLERPDDATSFAARMAAYRERYATGVELPIESVSGVGNANHWTAWVVNEDKWRFYLAPLAELIATSLTRNFVKPLAAKLGHNGDVRLIASGKLLTQKPDKTDAAIRLAQLGGYLSDAAVLEATGFNPDEDSGTGIRESNGRLPDLPVTYRDTTPNG